MKMRTLALALALAITGSIGMAQPATRTKLPKAPKVKAVKVNTKSQNKFNASHKITKRAAVKTPPKHAAKQAVVRKAPKVKVNKHA